MLLWFRGKSLVCLRGFLYPKQNGNTTASVQHGTEPLTVSSNLRITESFRLEKTSRSSSSTVNPTLLSPLLNHALKYQVYTDILSHFRKAGSQIT